MVQGRLEKHPGAVSGLAFEVRARGGQILLSAPLCVAVPEGRARLGSQARANGAGFWGRKVGMAKRVVEKHPGGVSGVRLDLREKGRSSDSD